MTALVTGASGFLGGRLASILAAQGETVRILARPTSDLRHLAGVKYEIAIGSLDDEESLAAAVRGASRIYHCAGCSTDWAPWPEYLRVNVDGVGRLLKAASANSALERFVHVSTTDVYGYPTQPCDESTPPVDVGLPYNRSKLMGEALVRGSGLPITIVRPATIYGPRGKAFTADIAQLLRQGSMAVIDGGRAPGGFCYVDNAAEAIVAAARSPITLGRVYNIADGTGITWRQYVDHLANGLGCRKAWIDLPFRAAMALARVTEAPNRYLHLPGRPLLTRHAVYLLGRNQEYPTENARRDFAFSPSVPFEEGMARSVEWLKTLESPPAAAASTQRADFRKGN